MDVEFFQHPWAVHHMDRSKESLCFLKRKETCTMKNVPQNEDASHVVKLFIPIQFHELTAHDKKRGSKDDAHFASYLFKKIEIECTLKHKHLISSVDWWHTYMFKSSHGGSSIWPWWSFWYVETSNYNSCYAILRKTIAWPNHEHFGGFQRHQTVILHFYLLWISGKRQNTQRIEKLKSNF